MEQISERGMNDSTKPLVKLTSIQGETLIKESQTPMYSFIIHSLQHFLSIPYDLASFTFLYTHSFFTLANSFH